MYVTSSDQRSGLLVAVITGGRPALRERATAKLLPALADLGVADTVWVVSDRDAPAYEPDRHPHAVYPREWAEEYAAAHWMAPAKPEPGAFLGAFPGREWACHLAEERGCWGVLQLDDNIDDLAIIRRGVAGWRVSRRHGDLALYTDLLAALALSTNARMIGAALNSNPKLPRSDWKVARPGFPYSLFVERVGPGREPWHGPFEDDITHALQYGSRADGATAALTPFLTYHKENKAKTGMRTSYNHTRAVQLQRCFPEGAKVNVRAKRSNGRGTPRIFHTMNRGAIRNPLTVHDPALFSLAKGTVQALTAEWHTEWTQANREKVARRVDQARSPRRRRRSP